MSNSIESSADAPVPGLAEQGAMNSPRLSIDHDRVCQFKKFWPSWLTMICSA